MGAIWHLFIVMLSSHKSDGNARCSVFDAYIYTVFSVCANSSTSQRVIHQRHLIIGEKPSKMSVEALLPCGFLRQMTFGYSCLYTPPKRRASWGWARQFILNPMRKKWTAHAIYPFLSGFSLAAGSQIRKKGREFKIFLVKQPLLAK